jgi:hypothetical protein
MFGSLRVALVASLSLALLSACAGGASPESPGASGAPPDTMNARPRNGYDATLYALNVGGKTATVTVYAQGGAKLLRTVSLGSVDSGSQRLYDMTTSSAGFLYTESPTQPSLGHSKGTLNIYENKGGKHIGSAKLEMNYHLITADAEGNVYVMCNTAELCEFTSRGKSVRKINIGKLGKPAWRNIQALAVDHSGNLAVISDYQAAVFPPGALTPTWTINDEGSEGETLNKSATFDSSGNLYIGANTNQVLVYPSNAESPSMAIPVYSPNQLVCDATGNLYVLNGESVIKFSAGQSVPEYTITDGISYAKSIAVDAEGTLYVANEGEPSQSGSVTTYGAGTGKLLQTLTKGIINPSAVGVTP